VPLYTHARETAKGPSVADYLGACIHNENLSRLAGAIEDATWNGKEAKVSAGHGCDLSDASLNAFARTVAGLVRMASDAPDNRSDAEPVELELRRLGDLERGEVITRHFRGPNAL